MSIIKELRHLMPNRALSTMDARSVAERQATRFLALMEVTEPHVPMTLVDELRKVEVRVKPGLPASGMTYWSKGRWLITLNADDAAVRQRFSLAHEFKHVLDHPFIDRAYPAELGKSRQERGELICDYFAACLLMPRPWVKRAWVSGVQNIDALAELFGVSRAAMQYRLNDIGLTQPQRLRHYFRDVPSRLAVPEPTYAPLEMAA